MAMVRRHPAAFFTLSALALLTACVAMLRSAAFAKNPDLAAWGVTFDLTISLPALYWFFVVRTGKAHALTIAPVLIAGTILAAVLIPKSHQQFLQQLRIVVPAAEVLVVVGIVRGVRAGNSRVAAFVIAEARMFYYAIFGWTKKPERDGITFHERAGWGSILACIFVLIAAEGLGMHLLLGRWSTTAAWAWTALDFWAAMWLLGDYHALRLERSFIDDDAFHLRYGMRWSLTIPLANIASIEEIRGESAWKRKDVLKVAILEDPRWLVTLTESMTAQGLAGIRKTVIALALRPDDDDALRALKRVVG
jgi:hypothetical protein